MKYVTPAITETAFNCPHCDVLASQQWLGIEVVELQGSVASARVILGFGGTGSSPPSLTRKSGEMPFATVSNALVSHCFNCTALAFWVSGSIVWPIRGDSPPANPDMPVDVRGDYEEAGTILDRSPRGAAALLRLALQKLCKDLGEKGEHIDSDIKALVAKGLNPLLQKALDSVRVIGNEAVHPGQIDLRDDRATAESLFGLVNLIVQRMISEPKQVDEVYANLPETKRAAIEKRDAKS